MAEVLRDADDGCVSEPICIDEGIELLTQRIAVEVAIGEGLVDDGDWRRRGSVVGGKCAALQDGVADSTKVFRRNAGDAYGSPGASGRRRHRGPESDGGGADPLQWQRARNGRRADIGKRF